jgi:hypothetical protein
VSPGVIPRTESLFNPVRDRYGWRLALVFGNHAPGGFCPYYTKDRCFHCDIGAGEGAAFDLGANRQRLAWFQEYYRHDLASIDHLVVYNSGSVLNSREMPSEMLDEIMAFARSLPRARVISLDSREPYIKRDVLSRLSLALGTGFTIRPILGIETADDELRNGLLRKEMSQAAIGRVFRELGEVAVACGHGRIGLDVNIVIAGPGTNEETAVDDALRTARMAIQAGLEHGINVDLNLHPYYRSARGIAYFPEHPCCPAATTARAAAKIAEAIRSKATNTAVYIGCNDEGHDQERRLRLPHRNGTVDAFDLFNQFNDPSVLRGLMD